MTTMISDDAAKAFSIPLPDEFVNYRELGGGNIPPWEFLDEEESLLLKKIVDSKYLDHKECLPFAQSISSDDIALLTPRGLVRSLHLNASRGWESPEKDIPFTAWMHAACKECVSYLQSLPKRLEPD